MKIFKHLIFILLITFTSKNIFAQNVTLNVVTQSAGVVKKGELIYFEVYVNNTSATKVVPKYKLRPQISFPTSLVSVQQTGHELPKGWTIISNAKGVVTLSNGTDNIDPNTSRRILISIKGNGLGGPSTISGNLLFSNGFEPGSVPGISTVGDNLADNISTSTVMVVK
jgi:hypothetical protein